MTEINHRGAKLNRFSPLGSVKVEAGARKQFYRLVFFSRECRVRFPTAFSNARENSNRCELTRRVTDRFGQHFSGSVHFFERVV